MAVVPALRMSKLRAGTCRGLSTSGTRTPGSRSARPRLVELLAAAQASTALTPTRALASLGEVTSVAAAEQKVPDLLSSPAFAALLGRVEARLFSFSAMEAYLLVVCLCKLDKSAEVGAEVRSTLRAALQQLADDMEELGAEALAHLLQLRARLEEVAPSDFWPGLHALMARRLSLDAAGGTSCKALCRLAAAWRRLQRPNEVQELARACQQRLDQFSPGQLSQLGADLAQLGVPQDILETIAERGRLLGLPLAAKELAQVAELVVCAELTELGPAVVQRAYQQAHLCQAGEAIQLLRCLCALQQFGGSDLVRVLLMQVAKVPRTFLAEEEDMGLHQVALSLLHEPAAVEVQRGVGDELWEVCYRPEEVVMEASEPAEAELGALLPALEAEAESVELGQRIDGFYWLPLVLHLGGGRRLGVELQVRSNQAAPDDLFWRLKRRHLELLGLPTLRMLQGNEPGDLALQVRHFREA